MSSFHPHSQPILLAPGVSVGVGEIGEADAIRAAEAQEEIEVLKKENVELRARLEAAGLH